MDKSAILDRMQEIFREIFDDETLVIRRETAAKDIEDWDSLNHISLIVAIEKEFHFKFGLDELQSLKDVGDTVDLIAIKVSQRSELLSF